MACKRIQDVVVGDRLYFPTMGERTVTEVLTNVMECRHGRYDRPQIVFHYENEAWGNNWPTDTTETIEVRNA